MKVISFINQKGGTGKTTTCINVGACLAEQGYKVLFIDVDAQGNLTTSVGLKDIEDNDKTVYEVLKGKVNINDAIINVGAYDILPTDIRQSGADIELSNIPGREKLLKEAIEDINQVYDYVLIDCPPSLNIIALMALTASHSVIIPVQAQYLALNGLKQLTNTIDLVKKRMNEALFILGVVITMHDGRKTLDTLIYETVASVFPNNIFNTTISNNVALAEAPLHGKDILAYSPKSKGAEQYKKLTQEIIERGKTV